MGGKFQIFSTVRMNKAKGTGMEGLAGQFFDQFGQGLILNRGLLAAAAVEWVPD